MAQLARFLALFLAFAAYAANGAQAHLAVSKGETVSVLMCGLGGEHHFTTIEFGEDGPIEVSQTCCGDCTAPAALPADPPLRLMLPASRLSEPGTRAVPDIYPRSPLWPGAPPHGPPSNRKA